MQKHKHALNKTRNNLNHLKPAETTQKLPKTTWNNLKPAEL